MNFKRAEIHKILQEDPDRIKLEEVKRYSDLVGVNQRIILDTDGDETPTDYFLCSKCPKSAMSRIIKAAKNNCRHSLQSHLQTHKKVSF